MSPAPGRPNWKSDHDYHDLLYLGWGERDFAKHPLYPHFKKGWSVTILLSGTVRWRGDNQQLILKKGEVLLTAPGTFSLSHQTGERCELRVWIWKNPPRDDLLSFFGKGALHHTISAKLRTDFTRIHDQCCQEVSAPDCYSDQSFRSLRDHLEILLLRSIQTPSREDRESRRMQLAEDWIRENLHLSQPVECLCDYLRISPNSLLRMFRHHHQQSPRQFIQNHKMLEANRLLREEGLLLKEVAYRLGYQYPNDLSRALKKYASIL